MTTPRRLHDLKLPRVVRYEARAIVSKENILKNRSIELQILLGRIKELLRDDELLIIASQDAFERATAPAKTAEQPKEDTANLFGTIRANRNNNYYTTYVTNATTTTATWR